jgi:hypothetical protein
VQQHRELLAAVARDQIVVAQPRGEGLRGGAQQRVAALAAVRVVEALEVIQVDEADAAGLASAARALQALGEFLVPHAPVGHARERVHARRLLELAPSSACRFTDCASAR